VIEKEGGKELKMSARYGQQELGPLGGVIIVTGFGVFVLVLLACGCYGLFLDCKRKKCWKAVGKCVDDE